VLSYRLKIWTCDSHAGEDYSYLANIVKNKRNINVQLGENSGSRFREMLFLMSEARIIVCPLQKDKITYCVGLSSIADSIALGIPVIITRNPYHSIDVDREKIGIIVDSEDEWIAAVNKLQNPDLLNQYSRNARNLAERKYNINICAKQIMSVLSQFYHK
jgi:glycosyltransferase involved in cell wall biosynthesis